MGETRLQSDLLDVRGLSPEERRAMYEVFAHHYDCVCWERFLADLEDKDCVILLRDSTTGEVSGFSTQKLLVCSVDDIPVRAIFSGDTIVDRSSWGDQELGRAWCRYVSAVYCEDPAKPLYWFLISKGYRTYLYLTLFFHEFYPRFDRPTPRFEQRVLDALAGTKFPGAYQPTTGLVLFPQSLGQLKPDLAAVPPRRQEDENVRFFLRKNPRYAEGVELACLAEISPTNMKLFAGRILAGAVSATADHGGRH